MVCPTLSQYATSALGGWALTSIFLLVLAGSTWWLEWIGKNKGWVVLSGLLAFAGPFVYEAIKTPCVTFPARGLTIAVMVGAQTLLLLYGQGHANREQQAAEARLNAIGTEVNRIGTGVNEQGARLNRIGTEVNRIGLGAEQQGSLLRDLAIKSEQQGSLLSRIADGIAAGDEEDSESQERER